MKREIVHVGSCTESWRRIGRLPDIQASGEEVAICAGIARQHMICDSCGGKIAAGDDCSAISVTTPDQRPYPQWEDEYVGELGS